MENLMRLKASLKIVNGLIVAIASAGMFTACTTRSMSGELSDGSKAEKIDLAMEKALKQAEQPAAVEVVAQPHTQMAEMVVVNEQRGAIELTLLAGEGYNQLLLKSEGGAVDCEVTELADPARLVLDVPGLIIHKSEEVDASQSALVSQVRLGGHGQTGRVVLDLNETVDYELDKNFGSVVLTMRGASTVVSESVEMQMAAIEPEPVEPGVAEVVLPVSEVVFEQEEKESSEVLAVLEDSEPAVEVAGSLYPQLKGLQLQKVSAGSNVLLADMEAAGGYTFEQTAPSEYVLTLENATIADGVENTLVSPVGAGLIRSVRAAQNGENVAVRINTELGQELQVSPKGNMLVVAAHKEQLNKDSKVMAQAELEGDTDEALDEELSAPVDTAALPSEDELSELFGAEAKYTGRLISLDLQDTEIDNALRIIAEVSNLNIIASDDVTGKVTLRLIDVPWDQALDVILKTNALDKVQEGNVVRIAPVEKLRAEREVLRQAQQAEDELEPLRVQYIRISYAKAADLQPLVETVITERGTVTYDDRSNQLIVKDIGKGLKNVAKLVQKLDLRTPQVLIETQIVEAQRSFVRELGAELGFTYIRSPETGNALGYNFPNSMSIGGSSEDARGDQVIDVAPNASFFPASNAAAAVSALFSSADGSKSLNTRITAAEAEGRVRVVSRPSVAVTNNSPAVIKSVEKLRIKLPSGGVSVATGQGANAAGGGTVATEVIEIGIVLNVTAQASPDYYVLLDINAKSSTLGPQADAVDQIPPEIERSATSTVLVSSGQTFAMGGIYRITEDSSIQGVPFLKDIPVLGHFFRRTGVNDIDEELIFFITPRIIEGSFDDAAMKAVS